MTALGGLLVAGGAGAACRAIEETSGERAGKFARAGVTGAAILANLALPDSGMKRLLDNAGKGVVGAIGDKLGGELVSKARAANEERAAAKAALAVAQEAQKIREELAQEEGEPVGVVKRGGELAA